MRCLFLYNPKSGKGAINKKSDYIASRLKENYDIVDVVKTESRDHLLSVAKSSCGTYDVLVFAGGDGTFNNIVNAIAEQQSRPTLGYIPTGTVCDIAKNLDISKNVKKSLNVILKGKYIEHDLGKNNDTYFMYVTGFGDFTSVAYKTPHDNKKFWGRLAYYFGAVKELANYQNHDVLFKIDEETYSANTPLLIIVNSKSVGGFKFNKKGHRNDGTFDVFVVNGKHLTGLLNLINLIMFGKLRIGKKWLSDHYVVDKITVDVGDDIIWTNDGEEGVSGLCRISNLPKHIKVFANIK